VSATQETNAGQLQTGPPRRQAALLEPDSELVISSRSQLPWALADPARAD